MRDRMAQWLTDNLPGWFLEGSSICARKAPNSHRSSTTPVNRDVVHNSFA
jgi:hypothetical protein